MFSCSIAKWAGGAIALAALCFPTSTFAQDRDRDWDHDRDRVVRLDPGTTIPVRLTEPINAGPGDVRVYHAVVDQDVVNRDGRLAIPRRTPAELRVHAGDDGNLSVHLEALIIHGDRYGTRSDPDHIRGEQNNSLVGTIIGAINGGRNGEPVHVDRDTVLAFRLDRPLEIRRHEER